MFLYHLLFFFGELGIVFKPIVHHSLEGGPCPAKTKMHDVVLVETVLGAEGCFLQLFYSQVVETHSQVQFKEDFGPLGSLNQVGDEW